MTLLITNRTYQNGRHVSVEVLFGQRLVVTKDLPLDVKQTIAYYGQCGFVYVDAASRQEHYEFH